MAINPALETWPAQFGRPRIQYDEAPVDPVLRTEMERGHKARSQFADPSFDYGYEVVLTNEAYYYFRAWHQHKISNGADWFNMPVKADGELEYQEARFRGMYAPRPAGDNQHWIVSLQLETRTADIPSEASLDDWLA